MKSLICVSEGPDSRGEWAGDAEAERHDAGAGHSQKADAVSLRHARAFQLVSLACGGSPPTDSVTDSEPRCIHYNPPYQPRSVFSSGAGRSRRSTIANTHSGDDAAVICSKYTLPQRRGLVSPRTSAFAKPSATLSLPEVRPCPLRSGHALSHLPDYVVLHPGLPSGIIRLTLERYRDDYHYPRARMTRTNSVNDCLIMSLCFVREGQHK